MELNGRRRRRRRRRGEGEGEGKGGERSHTPLLPYHQECLPHTPSNTHLAVDGPSFAIMREHFREEFERVREGGEDGGEREGGEDGGERERGGVSR